MILETGPMKELFLSVLKRGKVKYAFRVENFCIMGNHFHLVIRPGKGENLSAIMRWIMSVFAMAFNRIWNLTGHVWGSRFFSRIISCLRELAEVFDYIDGNPVRAGQAADKGDWPHCGLWHRRTGDRSVLDEMPEGLGLLFPEHAALLLC